MRLYLHVNVIVNYVHLTSPTSVTSDSFDTLIRNYMARNGIRTMEKELETERRISVRMD